MNSGRLVYSKIKKKRIFLFYFFIYVNIDWVILQQILALLGYILIRHANSYGAIIDNFDHFMSFKWSTHNIGMQPFCYKKWKGITTGAIFFQHFHVAYSLNFIKENL